MKIERLKVEQFDDLLDFLDLVFSKSDSPHDFESFVPSLYQEREKMAQHHRVIMKDGKIVSVVGSFPMTYTIGNRVFSLEGIGSVSTHKRETGKGYMRLLMEDVLEHYKQNDVAISNLGGERKRYARFGYEKAGVSHSFYVTSKNANECTENAKSINLKFSVLKSDDTQSLKYAEALYNKELIRFDRSDSFYKRAICWRRHPFIITDNDGRNVGYLIASGNGGEISEIICESTDIFEAAVMTWVRNHASSTIYLPPWKPLYIERMSRICEDNKITNNVNWQIFNWDSVVGALLNAKASYTFLADGQANIGISGYGVLSILVKNNIAECARTECTPDISCDALLAMRLTCGHVAPDYAMELPPHLTALFKSWFPLPLYSYKADCV